MEHSEHAPEYQPHESVPAHDEQFEREKHVLCGWVIPVFGASDEVAGLADAIGIKTKMNSIIDHIGSLLSYYLTSTGHFFTYNLGCRLSLAKEMPVAVVPKTKLVRMHRPRPQKAEPTTMETVNPKKLDLCWKDEKSAFKSVFGGRPALTVGQKKFATIGEQKK